jgi:protoporphyrinogen oxidase
LAGSFQVADGALEKFYHHWFTSDLYILRLAERLGVAGQIVSRESRTGMYYAHNFFKLSSPGDVLRFTPLNLWNRLRLGFGVLAARRIKNWKRLESQTAEEWLIGLFGQRVYQVVWEPLLIGKFGELAPAVSAVWFWNKLKLRGGSRSKAGAERLAYFRGGFAGLADAVAAQAKRLGAEIRTGTEVTGLSVAGGNLTGVHTTRGIIPARAAILTPPLPIAADLLQAYVSSAYVERLRRIRFLSNVCLVLELDRSLSGLYWLNVNDPSFPFVAIVEHTNLEPASAYGNRHIVYLSKYVPRDTEFYRLPDEDLLDFSLAAIRRMFPEFSRDWILAYHVWRADYSQPIIEKNYGSMIPDMQTPIENVLLATMAQVYPEDRGTNYAVRAGLAAASILKARFLE